MGEFGGEFVNLSDEVESDVQSVDVAAFIVDVLNRQSALLVYVGGRDFLIGTTSLPRVMMPDGLVRGVLVIPENKTLWFGPNGRFVLGEDVLLIVRGAIRAGPETIFDLPEVRNPTLDPGRALVRIESEKMDEVLVDWFGAVAALEREASHAAGGVQIHRAIQACIHAACRDRSRSPITMEEGLTPALKGETWRRLPPLTVVFRGIYDFSDTLMATAWPGEHPSLWMRGENNFVRGSIGVPALRRSARAGEAMLPSSAAITVSGAVSVRWERLGLQTLLRAGPGVTPGSDEVPVTLRVVEDGMTPRWRSVYLNRCGLLGGREAVVWLEDVESASASMRKSVFTSSLETRATRYVLADTSLDAKAGGTSMQSSHYALHAKTSQDAMIEVNSGVCYQTQPFYPAEDRPAGGSYRVDLLAGFCLRATSLIVRGYSFHLTEGPRPSRPRPTDGVTTVPDGQDIWIESGGGTIGTHLTALHVDSQSWWFLGSSFPFHESARGAVSLINVGAGNVSWSDYPQINTELRRTDPLQERALFDPPSIAWSGGVFPLLMEGCFFRRYVTIAAPAQYAADVSNSMFVPIGGANSTWWLSATAIPSGTPPLRALAAPPPLSERRPPRLQARWWTPSS